MSQLLVVGNWKMNGSEATVAALLGEMVSAVQTPGVDVAICPPYVHLGQAVKAVASSFIAVGAQDCSSQASGAYTGEVSPVMLFDIGCRWVILGHSERRQYHGESDALVAAKLAAAVEAGLSPIVCVGETQEQRESGKAESVVAKQLVGALRNHAGIESLVIAYEPVWAIGTGLTASPQEAQAMHAYIRSVLEGIAGVDAVASRLLYGGSVKADNARELFAEEDIDGALVGGASLVASEFLSIVGAGST